MALLRLVVCVGGVYSTFLLWAIAQEKLSVPFPTFDNANSEKFTSSLIISMIQSAFSVVSSLIYMLVFRQSGGSFSDVVGFNHAHVNIPCKEQEAHKNGSPILKNDKHTSTMNGNDFAHTNGRVLAPDNSLRKTRRLLLWRYFQCALLLTAGAPFSFAALAHISYPAMVLGKSCKLVPVLLMNVLLYRRRFAPYKYLVVFLVTAGISMFVSFNEKKLPSREHVDSNTDGARMGSSFIGLSYVLINLAIDGAINSTQDEIFVRFKGVTGQQMMFWINFMSLLIMSVVTVLPFPHIPVLHPSPAWTSEVASALAFIRYHPSVMLPLLQYAFTGSIGQLFIFETLQHFGSLTLVTVTLTRKLFTMILSVVLFDHRLSLGQWLGAAIVFAGITVEVWAKREHVHAKRVLQEKERAEIKSL